ncbi:MAG: hypothetical protein IT335_13865 [Thermomicrobiales bacterium]|nr:hypothetical protein [Thermomicrobiales bacterium]
MTAVPFGQRAQQIHQHLQSTGIPLHDMRSSVSLEDRLGELQQLEELPSEDERIGTIEWMEALAPFAIPVESIAGPTSIRYFLDGSQKTLPGYFQSAIPILASVTAAAVLERRSPTDLQLVPGMLKLNSSWLVPEKAESPAIGQFVASARTSETAIVDPLDHLADDHAAYRAALDDYIGLEREAMSASRRLRRQGETELLRMWSNDPPADGSWLVYDGALREPVPQTVGLVKSFNRQYITGEHADQLFRLPAGHRTPMFRVNDRRHGGSYAVWYLRFWDAQGRDPRYGLVRVEVTYTGEPPPVDLLSAWILAERRPRASNDARWPTLIYPIHYLEQILKRYLAREVRYWPGAHAA